MRQRSDSALEACQRTALYRLRATEQPTYREEPFSALRQPSAHLLAQRKLSDAPWHGSDER